MAELEKIYYEVYTMKNRESGFEYASKFDTKEDAVIYLLNYSTTQGMKNIYWYCSDGKLYLFDEDSSDNKAYIEICYESIENKLKDVDLRSTYLSIVDSLNTYESWER